MIKLKEIIEKLKDKKSTIKEQIVIRLIICVLAVLVFMTISMILNFFVWLCPYIEMIIHVCALLLAVYEGSYIVWYLEIWTYGGVNIDTRKYYPYIQNAIFMVVTDIYAALGVVKPASKSAVASIGQKTFNKGNRVIYQYNLLLSDSGNVIDVKDIKEILQNELIRKSAEGFDGITFDVNGYPYLQVDSVLMDGSYMQLQIAILWNEEDKKNYEEEQEQQKAARLISSSIDDEVF